MRKPESRLPVKPRVVPRGRVFVLSGPSGVGKDAVLSKIKQFGRSYFFAITATTRPIRAGERNGLDYIFLDRDTFQHMISQGDLLEWAEVYGNLYGVPKSQVIEAQERGVDVIVKVDVQGASTIKRMMPDATLIFLVPPDMPSLEMRMRNRNTETEADFRLKLAAAQDEMKQAPSFDHQVVNHDGGIEAAAKSIDRIIQAGSACRVPDERV